jgi:2-oxoglutarate ferredoxin oxidoreductase subunit beta
VYDVKEEIASADDWEKAMTLSRQWGDRIPIGILYQQKKDTYTDRIEIFQKGPLISQPYDGKKLQTFLANMD